MSATTRATSPALAARATRVSALLPLTASRSAPCSASTARTARLPLDTAMSTGNAVPTVLRLVFGSSPSASKAAAVAASSSPIALASCSAGERSLEDGDGLAEAEGLADGDGPAAPGVGSPVEQAVKAMAPSAATSSTRTMLHTWRDTLMHPPCRVGSPHERHLAKRYRFGIIRRSRTAPAPWPVRTIRSSERGFGIATSPAGGSATSPAGGSATSPAGGLSGKPTGGSAAAQDLGGHLEVKAHRERLFLGESVDERCRAGDPRAVERDPRILRAAEDALRSRPRDLVESRAPDLLHVDVDLHALILVVAHALHLELTLEHVHHERV